MTSLDPRMSIGEIEANVHVYDVPVYGASVSLEDFRIVLQRLEQAETALKLLWSKVGKHGVAG